jgi:glycosyltransferase involved in cell wall biosynthesis
VNVLQVNKFWFPHGGVESYLAGVMDELRRRGHAVAEYGMRHPENGPVAFPETFVPFVELRHAGRGLRPLEKVRATARVLYEPRARRGVEEVCRAFAPDVAHVHLFERQLTTAVIHGLAASRVPIVQTFHDYGWVCANYTLMLGMERPCPMLCTRDGAWRAVRHRCVKRSLPASVLGAVELILRRDVFRYERRVRLFVSPSAYLREALIAGGLAPERVLHVPNYVRAADYEPRTEPGEYVLYVGRLSFEKGLWDLLEAAAALPTVPFRIVGRGPEADALAEAVAGRALGNVRLEGFRQGAELRELYRHALCVAMPSAWPENSPMVAYEAFASGKPVVGTRMGGIPELVGHGSEGLIVPGSDPAALAAAIGDLARSPARAREMGERAREKVLRLYDLPRHVDRLLEVYDDARRGGTARRARARAAGPAEGRTAEASAAGAHRLPSSAGVA